MGPKSRIPIATAIAPAVALFAAVAMLAPAWPAWWGAWAWAESGVPLRVGLLFAALSLAAALIASRGVASQLLQWAGTLRPSWRWLPGLWLLCWLARERRHFGDWVSIGFTTALIPDWILEPIIFYRQPLAHGFIWLHWRALYLVSPSWEIRDTIQMTMSLWGAMFLVLWGILCRELVGPGRRAGLLWLWCATSGLLALALGHIETYAISLSALFAACIACSRYLRGAGSLWMAAAACVVAVGVHPQHAILAAGVAAAIVPCWWLRSSWPVRGIGVGGGALLLAIGAAVLLLPQTRFVLENMTHGGTDKAFLSPAAALSGERAFQAANVVLIAIPMAVPLLLVSIWNRRAPIARLDARLFVAASAGAGIAYMIFVYNKLEMSEDWDLVGPSLALIQTATGVIILSAFPRRKGAIALLAGVVLQCALTGLQVVHRWQVEPKKAESYNRYLEDVRANQRIIEERWCRKSWEDMQRH